MRLPTINGLIRRRILINFRADPALVQRCLPAPFRPKLLGEEAVVGICLIRLEQLRPWFVPAPIGWAAENAAHRIAVCWQDAAGTSREGVYIPRRDSGSWLIHQAGGRLFPGEHQAARFRIQEGDDRIALSVRSTDGQVAIDLRGRRVAELPTGSHFGSLQAASDFFAAGSLGFSARRDDTCLDALRLHPHRWQMEPLAVDAVASSYFDDPARFPPGSIAFDCALLMRDIPHHWTAEAPLVIDGGFDRLETGMDVATASEPPTTPVSAR